VGPRIGSNIFFVDGTTPDGRPIELIGESNNDRPDSLAVYFKD